MSFLEIRRSVKRKATVIVFTKTIKITQIGSTIPDKIAFEMHRTQLFYYKSRQCSNYWEFGHSQKFCHSLIICRSCSFNHSEKECKENDEEKCESCGDDNEEKNTKKKLKF
ncbi:hypothetical protein NPIL_584151 [Nephila pilipes]|uniref:Uncharacterized protein n=1 Tax=Nephila pilipes TaxID=299642 RepID=A0A8X6SY18_NEPPI|nr:hypothetical protein NPIL_584151 [Nephila pilipes]